MSMDRATEQLLAYQNSQKLIRQTLHDLSGPLNKANGFAEELRYIREETLLLLAKLPEDIEPQLRESLLKQIDLEMRFCLDYINGSLQKLDDVMHKLRSVES